MIDAIHDRDHQRDARSETDRERAYLTARMAAELDATFRASCIEAEYAHNALTRAYIERCCSCAPARTLICTHCRFRHVCEQIDRTVSLALAQGAPSFGAQRGVSASQSRASDPDRFERSDAL